MHVYTHSATVLLSVPVMVYINVVLSGVVESTSTGKCGCPKDCVGPPVPGPPTSFIAVTTGNVSRTTAAAQCLSTGGRLAWVTASNLDLRISISSGFKQYCKNCTFLWIGMTYNTFTKDFELWNAAANNSHVTCALGTVPSSLSGMAHALTTEDCVGLEKLGNGTWSWKLANCANTVSVRAGTNNGYICEYKAPDCSAKWPDPPSTLCTVLTTTTQISTMAMPISTRASPISTRASPISTTTTPISTTPISTTTTPISTTTTHKTRRSSTSNTPLTISSTSVQATSSTAATTEPTHAVAVGVIVGASVGSVVAISLVAIAGFLLIKKGPNIPGSRKHRQIGVDESNATRNSQSTDESRKASKSQSIHIHVNA